MKKASFVLGYAGSILALVFSMLMILTVPLNLANNILNDMTEELSSEGVLALNSTALVMQEQGWTDFSKAGVVRAAEQAAEKSGLNIDKDVYRDAARFAYEKGLTVLISMIVVAVAIVLSLLALIATMIVKKAPTAGGVLLLLSAFFLLLAAIYTGTLMPTFIASVFLTLGGIAVFVPTHMNRPAPVGAKSFAPPPQSGYAPPQSGYAPPQSGYAPPQSGYAPPQNGYAPPLSVYTPPQAPSYGEVSGADNGLPFPDDPPKHEEKEV
jgi:hypothetical protein